MYFLTAYRNSVDLVDGFLDTQIKQQMLSHVFDKSIDSQNVIFNTNDLFVAVADNFQTWRIGEKLFLYRNDRLTDSTGRIEIGNSSSTLL